MIGESLPPDPIPGAGTRFDEEDHAAKKENQSMVDSTLNRT